MDFVANLLSAARWWRIWDKNRELHFMSFEVRFGLSAEHLLQGESVKKKKELDVALVVLKLFGIGSGGIVCAEGYCRRLCLDFRGKE